MKSKTLAIFGIGTCVLSVISSAEDLGGNYAAPVTLIVVSAMATIVFAIMAAVRLWKIQKIISILLLASSVVTLVYISAPIKIIGFVIFVWAVSLLWAMAKYEGLAKKFLKHRGFTPEEASLIQEDSRKGNHKSVEQQIAIAQERARAEYKKTTGVNIQDIIPEVGREISWVDIVNHVFRVMEFYRSDSIIVVTRK